MCKFFSLVSKGDGVPMYFNWDIRQKILNKELNYESADSHTSIADYYGFKGEMEDKLNKYEFNPLTKRFIVDQINTFYDRDTIERFCMTLNFATIVPQLIIKPIINPLKDFFVEKVTKEDLVLLKQWDSVMDSVMDSVRDSIGDSARDSVWDSVWDFIWNSVRNSVYGYTSSFFQIKKWEYINHNENENPFQSGITLWGKGIVPSFDGTNWRLHGHKGKTIWYGTIENVEKFISEN